MSWTPRTSEAIGGRWAISVPGGLAMAGLLILSRVLRPLAEEETGNVAVAMLAATAAGAAILLLAHLTVFRRRATDPVPWWWVVALGAVTGTVAGLLYTALVGEPLRAAGALALQGAWLMPLIAFVLATRAAYSAEFERLLAREVLLEAEARHQSGALNALRALCVDAESAGLMRGLRGTDAALAAMGNPQTTPAWGDASASLRHAAENVVRPTSHRLWTDDQRGQPRRRAVGITTSALRLTPLPTLPVAGLILLTLGSSAAGGSMQGRLAGVTVVASTLALVGLYTLGNRVLDRVPDRLRSAVGAFTIVAAGATTVAIGVVLRSPVALQGDVFAGIVVALIGVFAAIAATAKLSQREVIDAIRARITRAEVDLAVVRDATERVNREIAQYLHGTVQARLVAAAHAIEDAGLRGDDIALNHAVAVAQRALDTTLSGMADDAPTSIAALRESIDAEWSGLVAIAWQLESEQPSTREVECLDEVLRQALLNAVVHGGATRVAIRLAGTDAHDLAITVADNGIGPQSGPAGLGARSLDAATAGNWSLSPGPDGIGAVLAATIPRASA